MKLAGQTVLDKQAIQCVWSGSEFAQQQMQRNPDTMLALHEQGLLDRPRQAGELAETMRADLLDCQDEEALSVVLRRLRNREMVRIIWRDLLNLADLNETIEELSELADQCVQQGLALLYQWATAKFGVPRDSAGVEQQLIVLGMGKLGARELNLSSDIDLIFCYPSHGQTDGKRPVDNETFFTRLGRQLIQLLSKQTAEGFVFRVDMRLRPFGEAGPLVVSFGAMENYLYGQAREWERYAMVKARALTGQPETIIILDQMRKAFVFRRYIDFGVIEAIRSMKRMIAHELSNKGMDSNIKLGLGGIREVEFIGQALQLVRGGRDVDLQIRPIQQVLTVLGKKGLLPDYAVRELLQAYVFLRRTENRIQAWRDEQLHVLPQDEAGRQRLAQSMGFAAWDTFYPALQQHRQHVHAQFEQVFAAPQAEQGQEETSALAAVWLNEDESDQHITRLAENFEQAEVVWKCLVDFRGSAVVRTLSANARSKLDQLMSLVLEALAKQDDGNVTLQRVVGLLEAIVRRTAYLDLLNENPVALAQLLRLLRESVWVGSQLARQPILLDELLDPRRLYSPLHREELQLELQTLLASVAEGDLEQEMERLRQFVQGNRLRVAAADIADAIPLSVVSDYLTEIAETSLQQVQQSAWRDVVAKYGRPILPQAMDTGFAVIGYGKLGGIELGYGSDLDLVFLHGSEQAMTDGERSVANEVFYARLGQRMIHMLNTRTPSGQLYEVDMRLRPNGNSGMLVSSLKAFTQYQQNNAWTWEHQALLRARAVAGDAVLIEQFKQARKDILRQPRDEQKLRDEVKTMRAKMAENLDRSDEGLFDIKQGAGGLVDIEFMVQFAVLRWAYEHPGLVEWTDNARLLERLAEYQLLEGQSAELLFNAYRVFRAVSHRKALQEEKSLISQDELQEERAMVREIWQQMMLKDVAQ